jgi:hypothetical protein
MICDLREIHLEPDMNREVVVRTGAQTWIEGPEVQTCSTRAVNGIPLRVNRGPKSQG